jgi:hypothetical protein
VKIFYLMIFSFVLVLVNTLQVAAQDNGEEKIAMKRYVVERNYSQPLELPLNEEGCLIVQGVVSNNTENQVVWIHSYISADKMKSFCIYEAPSPEAIRKAAAQNEIPVDKITEVSVLDPYFFK